MSDGTTSARVETAPTGAATAGAPEILAPQKAEADIIRKEITTAMVMAGVAAAREWESRCEAGDQLTKTDLVCAVYAAMRRLTS